MLTRDLSMTSARTAIISVGLTALVAMLIAIVYLANEPHSAPIPAVGVIKVGDAPAEVNGGIGLTRRPSPPPSSWRVVVRDVHGTPLPQATLCGAQEALRSYSSDQLTQFGSTASDGVLDVPLTSSTSIILACKSGYQTSQATVGPDDRLVTISMPAAATMEIRCITRDGRPIELATVAASAGDLDIESQLNPNGDSTPGGDPLTALHWGRTDAMGYLRLEGLPVGCQISAFARHDHYAYIAGLPETKMIVLDSGRNPFELLFDPLVGFSFRILGDDLVSWNVPLPTSLQQHPIAVHQTDIQRKRLNSDGPCYLCCPRWKEGAGYSIVPPRVPVRVLTAKRGWVTLRPSIRPAADLGAVEAIDVSGEPLSNTGELLLRLLSPSGQLRDVGRLYLRPGGDLRTLILAEAGEPISLPAGEYNILPRGEFLRVDNPTIKIESGHVNEITRQLAQDLVPILLKLRDSAGIALTSGDVRFLSGGIRSSASLAYGLQRRLFWVPQGKLDLTIRAPGCESTEISVDVLDNDTESPFTIECTLRRLSQ